MTSGEWWVNSINEIDDAGGWIYFTGRPNKSWDAQLMRVHFDGSGMEQLTEGDGVHSARVSPGGTYFIDSVSNIHEPTKVTLHNGDGSAVRELGNAPPEPEVSLPLWNDYSASKSFESLGLDNAVLRNNLPAGGERTLVAIFASILQTYAEAHGKARCGEKTPRHYLYIDTLLEWFPRATVVFVVRDPRAVAASLLRVDR